MKIKTIWIFLAAITLVLLTCETALFAATIKTSDYWVMQDGYNEVFVASAGSEYLTVTYGSYARIEGEVFEVDYPGPLAQFLKYDGAGNLVYYGATFSDTDGAEWVYTVENPQTFLPAVLETGEEIKFGWQRQEYENGFPAGTGSDNFTITLSEELGVIVSAGKFDTLRMDLKDVYVPNSGDIKTTYRTYWLAKGIGWVKMKIEGVEYELYNTPSLSPLPPVLKVTKSGYTVTISWDAVEGATGYIFVYAPYPDASWVEMLDVGLNRSFSGELPHGSAYYVCILAYNNVGSSDYSNLEYFVLDGSTPLQVNPTSLTLETGETGTCAISGGTGYYDAYSSNSSVAEVTVSGSTLNVLGGAAGSATITVYDSAFAIIPVSVTVTGGNNPISVSVTIQATNSDWTDTGVYVENGKTLFVATTGMIRVCCGSSPLDISPDGEPPSNTDDFPAPSLPAYSLIGRIGNDGTPFFVGSSYVGSISTSGKLHLIVNDCEHWDNTGFFTSTISTN